VVPPAFVAARAATSYARYRAHPVSLTAKPLREQPALWAPEWISPLDLLPRTVRQVSEEGNGYLAPGWPGCPYYTM